MTRPATVPAVDFSARYAVDGRPGVAFRLTGWAKIWDPVLAWCEDEDTGEVYEEETGEGEWVDDPDRAQVIAVMVGDDREHTVDVDDLTELGEGAFCGCCGQVGCAWG